MRPAYSRRVRAVAALAAFSVLAIGLAGAGGSRKNRDKADPPKLEEAVGDLAFIQAHTGTKLEGVGLVIGLENTGVDPPPSYYRQKLLDEMKKAGIENGNAWLRDSRVAMVIVRMEIPAGVSTSDRLDATVEVPPGGGTKSLVGGRLLECRLREVMVLGGTPKEGPEAATVLGPVMTGSESDPKNLKIGRILGGGRVKKEIPFQLILNDNRKSGRIAKLVETVLNQRFPQTRGVDQKGSALAKTDQFLELKVPPAYHHNQDRFFRVVKLLPMIDSPALHIARTEAWQKELLDPRTTGMAALRLEGLGVTADDALKTGLTSPNAQVRFFAAEALAYLGDASGADELARAAIETPVFRSYALTALASTDQSAAHMKLRKLMDESDVELRYGAFNALRTLAGDDPFLGQVRVLEDPREAEDEEGTDSMAVALTRSTNRTRRPDPFSLYMVDCDGPPMVHVARTRRCEVVVFGRGQKLLTPVVLGTGPLLLNAAADDDTLQISKIVPGKTSESDSKVSSSLELGDVLRQIASLGANYPEIVTILQSASRQKNLAGPLVVDALPGNSPLYIEAELLGKDTTAKKDDGLKKAGFEKEKSKSKRKSFLGRLFGSGS